MSSWMKYLSSIFTIKNDDHLIIIKKEGLRGSRVSLRKTPEHNYSINNDSINDIILTQVSHVISSNDNRNYCDSYVGAGCEAPKPFKFVEGCGGLSRDQKVPSCSMITSTVIIIIFLII